MEDNERTAYVITYYRNNCYSNLGIVTEREKLEGVVSQLVRDKLGETLRQIGSELTANQFLCGVTKDEYRETRNEDGVEYWASTHLNGVCVRIETKETRWELEVKPMPVLGLEAENKNGLNS